MGAKTHILIIDAQTLIRDGLSALLNLEQDLQVIGAIGTSSAITRVSLPAAPDLVILDVDIPDYNGLDTLTEIRSRWPAARVMVLTFCRDEATLQAALRAGVDAYLLKSDTRGELLAALQCIKEGKEFVSPTLLNRASMTQARKPPSKREHRSDGLSDRERDVLKRIAQGRRTREIAQELSLSHKTIEKYRSNLMRKLGLRTATAVAAYAITNGYLDC
jgi:DNA-binding NarL/FixJ family response regulator